MNLLGGRTLIAIAVLLVGGLAAFLLLRDSEQTIDPDTAARMARNAGDELESSTVDVSIAISLISPDPVGPQTFSARGTVDFQRGAAALTYDFEELINAGGAFGHLDEFEVIFDGDLVYIRVFEGDKPWVSFRPPELAGRDTERLREVVLASPLVVPDYLRGVRDLTGVEKGATTVIGGTVVPSILTGPQSDSTVQLQKLLKGLEAEVVSVTAELREGTATRVTHEFPFPIAAGAEEDVLARVVIDIEPSEGAEIVAPGDAETRRFKSLFDRTP
ncbi:MAG: hypothetical protein ACRDI3_01630 [Actinomycetota bacterium]